MLLMAVSVVCCLGIYYVVLVLKKEGGKISKSYNWPVWAPKKCECERETWHRCGSEAKINLLKCKKKGGRKTVETQLLFGQFRLDYSQKRQQSRILTESMMAFFSSRLLYTKLWRLLLFDGSTQQQRAESLKLRQVWIQASCFH